MEKLKVKIGEHVFESEGPSEIVERRFAAFKEMIASFSGKSVIPAITEIESQTTILPASSPRSSWDAILKNDGRVISLTALPETTEDAALLILLGQRELRANDSVTGNEMMSGLTQSGYALERVDRMMERFVAEGLVIRIGVHRAKRYRLTNQGYAKAKALAETLLAKLP